MAEIGIGMLGYAFMGKAHSNAFRKVEYMAWPPPLEPRLVVIAGRNQDAVAEAARRYGYERWTTDWHDIVTDERIGLFDNGGPNSLHAEPTIAAAEAATLATWRFDPDQAGSGALGDLGTHVIDLARYLVGEVNSVAGIVKTFVRGRRVDDAIEAAVGFESGAVGTIESTRLALGRRNAFQWEINGSRGSLYFDMERMNELQVFLDGEDRTRGFRRVLVTEANHPFMDFWWPPGHIIGWGDTFVHEVHHLLRSIADGSDVAPHGATFEDGYRASEIGDAIVRSSASGRREELTFRGLTEGE